MGIWKPGRLGSCRSWRGTLITPHGDLEELSALETQVLALGLITPHGDLEADGAAGAPVLHSRLITPHGDLEEGMPEE